MSEGRISKVNTSSTRTSDGRKIDTWRIDFPDGKTEITVNMHSSGDDINFAAQGKHPAIKGLSWEGSDLAALRRAVMDDVEKAARRYFETEWSPAVALEVSLYKSDRKDTAGIQLSFDMIDIHCDPSSSIGNQGETRVLKNHHDIVMIQRSHDQTFESDGSLSSKNMNYSMEQGKTLSRSVIGAEDREAAVALSKALEAFSIKLMRRMAPDVVKLDGVPSPDDLLDVMRSAIDDPEEEQRDETEFRM